MVGTPPPAATFAEVGLTGSRLIVPVILQNCPQTVETDVCFTPDCAAERDVSIRQNQIASHGSGVIASTRYPKDSNIAATINQITRR
jgi:hypothetical protein